MFRELLGPRGSKKSLAETVAGRGTGVGELGEEKPAKLNLASQEFYSIINSNGQSRCDIRKI